jgi:TIR domain
MGEAAHGKSWEFDFFVSYTREDVKQAEWIAWVLNQAGYRVIIQRWNFTVGRNWFAEMDNASRIAERTVAVLSKAYGDSDYCRLEWQQAMELDPGGSKRKLVPIRIVPYKPDSYLRQVVYIDLVGLAEDEAREQIIAGAHQAVTGEAIPATAPSFVSSGAPPGAHRPPHPEVRLPDVPIPSERHVPRPGLLDEVRGLLVPGAGRGPTLTRLPVSASSRRCWETPPPSRTWRLAATGCGRCWPERPASSWPMTSGTRPLPVPLTWSCRMSGCSSPPGTGRHSAMAAPPAWWT